MGSWGEAIILSVVVARVTFVLLFFRFYYECIGLLLLSIMSLFIEFVIGGNRLPHVESRSGTSPGLFLGALTVPIVLVSRLVQSHRLSCVHNSQDFGNFRLEYWASCVSSAGMLSLLSCSLSGQKGSYFAIGRKGYSFGKGSASTVCLALLVAAVSCSFLFPFKLVLVLLHAAICTPLFQYILSVFPGCASLGEAMLVANGIIVYFGNVCTYTFRRLVFPMTSSINDPFLAVVRKDDISAVSQAILLGLLFVPQMYGTFFHAFSFLVCFFNSKRIVARDSRQNLCKAAAFYLSLTLALILLTPGWLFLVQGFQQHLFLWIIQFVFEEPVRLVFCGYWMIVLCGSVLPLYLVKTGKVQQILVRKLFHIMAIIMFIPALLLQQLFLRLAFCIAFCAFLILEMIRVWQIPPFGVLVDSFMKSFTDHRDSDVLIISHFSLLLGCALPLWLSGNSFDRPLAPFAGILSLGIGDTMASVIGIKFGSQKLSRDSKKTVEGTAAGIVSLILGSSIIHFFYANLNDIQWISLMIAVVCTALMEAFTLQLDNAFIPLIFFTLLNM